MPRPLPPGWYPDPPDSQRYWDGAQWTDQRAPMRKPLMPWWLQAILIVAVVLAVFFVFL